jgi:hypothetical protein
MASWAGDWLGAVYHLQVQRVWDDPGAYTLDFVRTGFEWLAFQMLTDYRTRIRFHSNGENPLFAFALDVMGNAGDGSAVRIPAMKRSKFPSVSSQISVPVVRKWMPGRAGF